MFSLQQISHTTCMCMSSMRKVVDDGKLPEQGEAVYDRWAASISFKHTFNIGALKYIA